MGGLLFVQDRLAEAQPYYQEAMDGYRRVLGDNHPDTLNAINSMGAVMENQGNLQEAGAYYQEALQRSRLVLGNDHPHTVAALNNLGGWLVGQGELVESRTLLQEALDTRERLLGPDHPDTLLSICNMGRLFVAIQQPDAAVELLLPAEVALRALPSGQYVALQAQFLHYLGSAHSQCGMFCEAEVELCDAYQLAQESSAQWRTGTLEVNNALADLYTRWDTAEPGAGHDSDAARYQLQRR
jgi:tetratricopeptide (TPR) repeat protein